MAFQAIYRYIERVGSHRCYVSAHFRIRMFGNMADISLYVLLPQRLHIDEGKPHFYPEVFKGAHVSEFLGNLSEKKATYPPLPSFTLTVVNPAHSGSLRGWTIDSLKVPGRFVTIWL